jgi:hypothetical protein
VFISELDETLKIPFIEGEPVVNPVFQRFPGKSAVEIVKVKMFDFCLDFPLSDINVPAALLEKLKNLFRSLIDTNNCGILFKNLVLNQWIAIAKVLVQMVVKKNILFPNFFHNGCPEGRNLLPANLKIKYNDEQFDLDRRIH